ncbi:hypothetical protein HDK90DRAFT_478282 [Phyllosticta capitalensis]|uniref:Uncharacterized protein n=1 Tax=Phyllosticta capitalensis TaxID=121624 RepID=A0ABR1Z184_9PEZI
MSTDRPTLLLALARCAGRRSVSQPTPALCAGSCTVELPTEPASCFPLLSSPLLTSPFAHPFRNPSSPIFRAENPQAPTCTIPYFVSSLANVFATVPALVPSQFSTARANLSTLCMYPGQPTPRSRPTGPTFPFVFALSCPLCSFVSLISLFFFIFRFVRHRHKSGWRETSKATLLCPPSLSTILHLRHPSMNVLYGAALSGGVMAALTLLRSVADLGRGWNFAGSMETKAGEGL